MQLVKKKRAELARESAFDISTPAPKKHVSARQVGAKRFLGLITALIIPGFVVATSLPAFALVQPAGPEGLLADGQSSYSDAPVQTLASSTEAAVSSKRAGFTAETHAQVEAKKQAAIWAAARKAAAREAAALRAAGPAVAASGGANTGGGGAYSTVGPRAAGDDYPFRAVSGLSPLRYVARQCVDFTAWRINRDAGSTGAPFKYDWSNMTPNGGSAGQWAQAWRNNGWKTSNTPVAGSIAWWSGHVAYVKSVSGGNVNLEEYNWNSSGAYSTRTVPSGSVQLYLYLSLIHI